MDKTHITLLVDRSGSMNSVRADAEGAINRFIAEQKEVPGDCTLILADFDAPAGIRSTGDWYRLVYEGPIAGCPTYELKPRGNTALLDAVGSVITETGEMLTALDDEAPDKVIVVIQTDGEENSSKDWSWDSARREIRHWTDKGWEFVFLGTGPDSWGQAERLGTHSTRSGATAKSYAGTYAMMSETVSRYRGGDVAHLADMNVDVDDEGNVTKRDD